MARIIQGIIAGAALTLAGIAIGAASAPRTQTSAVLFDHTAIHVADQQKSIDFYQGLFHFAEIPSPFPPGGPRWLVMGNGIELHIQPGRRQAITSPRQVHFAVTVPDLAPILAWLRAHQVAWVDSADRPGQISRTRSDGVQQIFLQDPDGYWIEINDVKRLA